MIWKTSDPAVQVVIDCHSYSVIMQSHSDFVITQRHSGSWSESITRFSEPSIQIYTTCLPCNHGRRVYRHFTSSQLLLALLVGPIPVPTLLGANSLVSVPSLTQDSGSSGTRQARCRENYCITLSAAVDTRYSILVKEISNGADHAISLAGGVAWAMEYHSTMKYHSFDREHPRSVFIRK